jgi:hypothetical protein
MLAATEPCPCYLTQELIDHRLCRYPVDWVPPHTDLKSRHGAGHATTSCHMPLSSGPASSLRRAPVLTSVHQQWTPPLCDMSPTCRTVTSMSSSVGISFSSAGLTAWSKQIGMQGGEGLTKSSEVGSELSFDNITSSTF